MTQLLDFAGIMNSAQAGMPDYAAQRAQEQLRQIQTDALKLQTEQAQRQLDGEEAFRSDLDQVLLNPTAEGYSQLILRHPEYADQIKSAHTMLDENRRRGDLRQMGEIYAAAANGKYDLAATSLERRIEADRAVDGAADPMDEAILAALKSGDPIQQKAAIGQIGLALASITGPEKFAATYGSLTEGSGLKSAGPGSVVYDQTGNVVLTVPFAPRPITVGEGDTVVEYQPGGGGPASSGGGAGSSAPRGIRNNNPGNLRDGPFAKSQPGYKGVDSGGFAIFESADHGLAAQTKLLKNSYIGRGVNTPTAIVARYAPSSENSPESMGNYVAHIAGRLGIGVNDPIRPEQAGVLAQAMAEFENGTSSGPRVIAQGPPKQEKPAEPSATRVVNGQVYVKVNGQWFRKAS